MQQEKISDLKIAYKNCFSTDSGKRVLAHLLNSAGMFDVDVNTTEALAIRNYAMCILKNMGLLYTEDSIREFVNKLLEMRME